MTTKPMEELHDKIERVVREHLTAQFKAATAAVERAFTSAATPTKMPVQRSTSGRRRAREMSELAQRLYEAVRAKPGETIAVIAADVGEPAKALHRPMFHLKREGRVRSAGQRHLTRYFPMATKS